ncbi:MAG: hypothetical protein LBP93_05940, partial [Treponema sp.]|nr:hypothetical protein [Treponema sp.]
MTYPEPFFGSGCIFFRKECSTIETIFNSEYENPLKLSSRQVKGGILIGGPWEGTCHAQDKQSG